VADTVFRTTSDWAVAV